MPTLHVRDVSDETLSALWVRATRGSIVAYIRQLLEGEAATLTVEEAAEQARSIAARGAVTATDVVEALDAARAAAVT